MAAEEHIDFYEVVESFYDRLNHSYLKHIQDADDKEYAAEYYKPVFFEHHPDLPIQSFYFQLVFDELLSQYKLKKSQALENTLQMLEVYKELADQNIEQKMVDQLLGEKDMDLGFLEQEKRLLELSNEQIVRLLALKLATHQLLEEYSYQKGIPKNTGVNTKQSYSVEFTENHQVLTLYFLIKVAGARPGRDCNKSDIYRLMHAAGRHNITNVDNQNIKKKVLEFESQKRGKKIIPDLEFILPFFKNANLVNAVKLIEHEINALKEDFK